MTERTRSNVTLEQDKSFDTPGEDEIRSSSSTPAVYQLNSKDTPGNLTGTMVTRTTTDRPQFTEQSKVFDGQNDSAIVSSINANDEIENVLDHTPQEQNNSAIQQTSRPTGMVIDIKEGHKS